MVGAADSSTRRDFRTIHQITDSSIAVFVWAYCFHSRGSCSRSAEPGAVAPFGGKHQRALSALLHSGFWQPLGRKSPLSPTEPPQPSCLEFQAQRRILFGFKQRFGEARLADDALQSAAPEGIVKRHRDGDGGPIFLRLHDSMAAALANRNKSVLFEYFRDFGSGKNPQSIQPAPRPA